MGLAPDLGVNRGPCPQGPRGRGRGKVDVSQATHMGESGVGISVLGHRGDRGRDTLRPYQLIRIGCCLMVLQSRTLWT